MPLFLRAISALALASVGLPAFAQATADDVRPTAPQGWSNTIKGSGHVKAGITINPANPPDGLNFGHLFMDKAGEPQLNQARATVERRVNSLSKAVDIGFKL